MERVVIVMVRNNDGTARVTLAQTEDELALADAGARLGGEAPGVAAIVVGEIGFDRSSPVGADLVIYSSGGPFAAKLPTRPVLEARLALVEFAALVIRPGLLAPGVRAVLELRPPATNREGWTDPLRFGVVEARPTGLVLSKWRSGR